MVTGTCHAALHESCDIPRIAINSKRQRHEWSACGRMPTPLRADAQLCRNSPTARKADVKIPGQIRPMRAQRTTWCCRHRHERMLRSSIKRNNSCGNYAGPDLLSFFCLFLWISHNKKFPLQTLLSQSSHGSICLHLPLPTSAQTKVRGAFVQFGATSRGLGSKRGTDAK